MSNKLPSQRVVSEVIPLSSTQATRILSANPDRKRVEFLFSGTAAVLLGSDNSVTVNTGIYKGSLPVDFNTTAEIWAILDAAQPIANGTGAVQTAEYLDPKLPDGFVAKTVILDTTPVMIAPHRPTRKLLISVSPALELGGGGVRFGTDDAVNASSTLSFSDLAETTLPVWAVGVPVLGDTFPTPFAFIEIYDVED